MVVLHFRDDNRSIQHQHIYSSQQLMRQQMCSSSMLINQDKADMLRLRVTSAWQLADEIDRLIVILAISRLQAGEITEKHRLTLRAGRSLLLVAQIGGGPGNRGARSDCPIRPPSGPGLITRPIIVQPSI